MFEDMPSVFSWLSVLSGPAGPSWLSVPSCISGLRGLRCFLCLRCLLSFLCLRCLLDVRVAFRIFGGPSGPSWSSFALCAFGASIGDFGALVVFGAFGAFCAFCAFVCFRCLQGLWLHSGPSGAFWFFGCIRGLRSNCFWITPWPLQEEKKRSGSLIVTFGCGGIAFCGSVISERGPHSPPRPTPTPCGMG